MNEIPKTAQKIIDLENELTKAKQRNHDVLKLIDAYEDLFVHIDHMPTDRSRIKNAFQSLNKLRVSIGIKWGDDGKALWKEENAGA